MDEPIVSWTTPFQRALARLNEAGEHLEFGRRKEAWASLRAAFGQLRALVSWLATNPDPRERRR